MHAGSPLPTPWVTYLPHINDVVLLSLIQYLGGGCTDIVMFASYNLNARDELCNFLIAASVIPAVITAQYSHSVSFTHTCPQACLRRVIASCDSLM